MLSWANDVIAGSSSERDAVTQHHAVDRKRYNDAVVIGLPDSACGGRMFIDSNLFRSSLRNRPDHQPAASSAIQEGWCRISCGFDVLFERGIPIRVSDNGWSSAEIGTTDAELLRCCGLHVHRGQWRFANTAGEFEAPLKIARHDFGEVLNRLARASAALYVDRFSGPIDRTATDWDREAYAYDFAAALAHCDLERGQINMAAFFPGYQRTMHEESVRLTRRSANDDSP